MHLSPRTSYFVLMFTLEQFDKLNIIVAALGVTAAGALVDAAAVADTVALTLTDVPALFTITLYGIPCITLLHIAC